jgi:hypothetical protein
MISKLDVINEVKEGGHVKCTIKLTQFEVRFQFFRFLLLVSSSRWTWLFPSLH